MWLDSFIYPDDFEAEPEDSAVLQYEQQYEQRKHDPHYLRSLVVIASGGLHKDKMDLYGQQLLDIAEKDPVKYAYELGGYYFSLARYEVYRKQWAAAIPLYLKSLEYNVYFETYYELGGCYGYLNELDKAEECILKAMEEYQKDEDCSQETTEMWLEAGLLMAKREKYKESIAVFNEYLEGHPNDWMCHYYIGQSWHFLGDDYRAMASYQKCLDINPRCAHVYNNYGAIALEDNDNVQEAISHFKHALELVEKEDNLKTKILMNLTRSYGLIADYDQEMYYQCEMLKSIGFDVEIVEEDDDEEDMEPEI